MAIQLQNLADRGIPVDTSGMKFFFLMSREKTSWDAKTRARVPIRRDDGATAFDVALAVVRPDADPTQISVKIWAFEPPTLDYNQEISLLNGDLRTGMVDNSRLGVDEITGEKRIFGGAMQWFAVTGIEGLSADVS